jgi:hypothetical protein
MIYFPATRVNVSTEFPVAVGSSIPAEGLALIADNTNGVFGLKPAAGGASEVFMGIAVSQQTVLTIATKTEAFVQPVTHQIVLAFTPVGGTVGVWDNTAQAAIATGGGGWTLSGKTLTLQAATDGHDIYVYYKYTPTANQARAIQGDVFPGGPAGTALSQIGCARSGIVYTDQFDTSVNWNANGIVVKTAANGQFTIGGAGTALTGVQVISPPVAGMPYLGLLINNA